MESVCGLLQKSGDILVQDVSRAPAFESPVDSTPAQGEIADGIQNFVPDAFIGPAELVVPRSFGTEDKHIRGGRPET